MTDPGDFGWLAGLPAWARGAAGAQLGFLGVVLVFSWLSSALGVGGYALLPLFVWHYGAKSGVAVITVYFLFQNLSKVALLWRHIDFGFAARLVAWAVPGAVLGGALLVALPARHLQRMLGAGMLALLLLPRLLPHLLPRRPAPSPRLRRLGVAGFALAYGVASGVLGSGNALKGPLLTSMGVLKERYVGTYALTSLALNVPKLAVYHQGGVASAGLLAACWPLLLVSLAGTYLGKRALRHIPESWFEKVTTAVFVVSALSMLVFPQ